MNGPARLVISCAIVFCAAGAAQAQPTLQTNPQPFVTAESEPWYQNAEPVMFAGNIYYRVGPQVHFNGNEMVRSGFFQGVPLYARTTVEPFSLVYVPLSGGLMQPYERRRTGDMAGTSGSSAPSFPVATSPGTVTALPQAAGPPTLASPIVFDEPFARLSAPQGAPVMAASATPVLSTASVSLAEARGNLQRERLLVSPQPVGTSGRAAPAPARRPVARRPQAANGIFIEFDGARWFSSGPSALFDEKIFTRVGELRGLPVYTARGRGATIFVPVAEGLDLVAPYSKRGK